jgi:mannosyltransferase
VSATAATGHGDPAPRDRKVRRAHGDPVLVSGLVLLAAAIRLPTLAQQSFWLDEGYTERLLRMSLSGMLHTIPKTESTPPAYYVLTWIWTHAFGLSEFGVRSLSALAGIATVPVAYAVARRLAGRRAAVITGLLLAVSPLMVWFSQEARAYALATLISTVTLLCTVAYLEEERDRWLIGWALAAALGLATHYFVVFVVAPEVGLLLWRVRPPRRDRRLAAAIAFVAVVAVALVPLALAQRGTGHADYIAQGSLGRRVLQVPKQLLEGYASPGQVITGVLASLVVAGGALWPLATQATPRRRAAVPLLVGLVCVLVPMALAVCGVDFLNTRNLLPALPPLYIAGAIGLASDRIWPTGGVLAAILAVLMVAVVVLVDTNVRYQRADWRNAGHALGSAATNRVIVVDPGSGLIPLQAYLPRLRGLSRPTPVTELDVIAVGGQSTGSGIANPPRPSGPPPVPPGFRLVGTVYNPAYTVLRYRSPIPTVVAPAVAQANLLGAGSYAPLVQAGPAGR